jgi:hypothetical protein
MAAASSGKNAQALLRFELTNHAALHVEKSVREAIPAICAVGLRKRAASPGNCVVRTAIYAYQLVQTPIVTQRRGVDDPPSRA